MPNARCIRQKLTALSLCHSATFSTAEVIPSTRRNSEDPMFAGIISFARHLARVCAESTQVNATPAIPSSETASSIIPIPHASRDVMENPSRKNLLQSRLICLLNSGVLRGPHCRVLGWLPCKLCYCRAWYRISPPLISYLFGSYSFSPVLPGSTMSRWQAGWFVRHAVRGPIVTTKRIVASCWLSTC